MAPIRFAEVQEGDPAQTQPTEYPAQLLADWCTQAREGRLEPSQTVDQALARERKRLTIVTMREALINAFCAEYLRVFKCVYKDLAVTYTAWGSVRTIDALHFAEGPLNVFEQFWRVNGVDAYNSRTDPAFAHWLDPGPPEACESEVMRRALLDEQDRVFAAAAKAHSYQEAWVYRTLLKAYPRCGVTAKRWRELAGDGWRAHANGEPPADLVRLAREAQNAGFSQQELEALAGIRETAQNLSTRIEDLVLVAGEMVGPWPRPQQPRTCTCASCQYSYCQGDCPQCWDETCVQCYPCRNRAVQAPDPAQIDAAVAQYRQEVPEPVRAAGYRGPMTEEEIIQLQERARHWLAVLEQHRVADYIQMGRRPTDG